MSCWARSKIGVICSLLNRLFRKQEISSYERIFIFFLSFAFPFLPRKTDLRAVLGIAAILGGRVVCSVALMEHALYLHTADCEWVGNFHLLLLKKRNRNSTSNNLPRS